jgi:WD40 repeat protein
MGGSPSKYDKFRQICRSSPNFHDEFISKVLPISNDSYLIIVASTLFSIINFQSKKQLKRYIDTQVWINATIELLNGKVATIGASSSLHIWNIYTGFIETNFTTEGYWSSFVLEIAPNIVVTCVDLKLTFWDITKSSDIKEPWKQIEHGSCMVMLKCPNGLVAAQSKYDLVIYDDQWTKQTTIKGSSYLIYLCDYKQGKGVIAGYLPYEIVIWSLSNYEILGRLIMHTPFLRGCLLYSEDELITINDVGAITFLKIQSTPKVKISMEHEYAALEHDNRTTQVRHFLSKSKSGVYMTTLLGRRVVYLH